MTNSELVERVAAVHGIDLNTVKQVTTALVLEMTRVLSEGDEVKLREFGTFRPQTYKVRAGNFEFGTVSSGGERRQIRFKPFGSTNFNVTEAWRQTQPQTPLK